jgi:DNA primase
MECLSSIVFLTHDINFLHMLCKGRIVICLDNDDAGIGAVERICSGSTIWDLLGKRGVEFAVANLPAGIKDPGEFVEKRMKSNAGSVRECFENEVINTAMLWNVWYIDRLIKKYDAEDSSSFANVCDSITTFLAKNPNAADRTRQAYEAAGKLATQISGKNEEGSSGPLRIQLESDLLGMASRKATKKDVIKKRIEAVDKLAQADVKGKGTKISEKSKNPSRIAKSNKITRGGTNSPKRSNGIMDSNNGQYANGSNNGNAAGYRTRQNYDRRQEVPIARHFAGFQFNPTDAAWLGISEKSQNVSILE